MARLIQPLALEKKTYQALTRMLKDPKCNARVRLRVQIILCLARGLGRAATATKVNTSEQTVSLWRKRFEQSGIEGLSDISGKGRKSTISQNTRSAVVSALTPSQANKQTMSQRQVARMLNISLRSVQRIWEEHTRKHPAVLKRVAKQKAWARNEKKKSKLKKESKSRNASLKKKDNPPLQSPGGSVSLSQIAKAANVSQSTVSRILRNDPRHNLQTRLRVQSIAIQMGYRENPFVQSLMTSIRHNRKSPTQATLALVFVCAKKSVWEPYPGNQVIINSIHKQAHRHGFSVDVFWPRDDKMPAERLVNILKTRNIRGVILIGAGFLQPERWDRWASLLKPFALVSLNSFPQKPACHYVVNNQYASTQLAYRSLLDLGYKRIGMVSCQLQRRAHGYQVDAGFFVAGKNEEKVPGFIVREAPIPDAKLEVFKQWLEEHRPDAIFTTNFFIEEALEKLGIRFPRDVGFATNRVDARFPKRSGIKQNDDKIATTAVDLVVNHLYLNEYGFPKNPTGIQIQGEWHPGKTVRKV